jgi:hypothetical protein
MDNEFDLSEIEKSSRPEMVIDITDAAYDIVRVFEIDREPDARTNRHFLTLEGKNFQIPPSLLRNIDAASTLEDMLIEFDQNTWEDDASIDLAFSYTTANDEPVTIILSKEKKESVSTVNYIARMIVGTDESDLALPELIPNHEINALFASIFAPNKTGDYSVFNSLRHDDPAILQNLSDALEDFSESMITNSIFIIRNEDGDEIGTIDYSTEDKALSHITIKRSLPNGGAIVLAIKPDDYRTSDEDTLDIADFVGVRAYLLDQDGTSSEIDCSTGELVSFYEFIKDVKKPLAATDEISVRNIDEIAEEIDPPHIFDS